ncbi:MAG: helix-turn-helix transcriptional regulator [Clostridiales bacterium]|nr:helix-turn-helix transcriptional regulator [Clostridiales bacterium]
MSLGEKIYQLRTAKNLSQEALSEAMDVSRQSISKWETDASVPELDKLIALSKFFEISLDELVLNQAIKKDSEPAENSKDSKNANTQFAPGSKQRTKSWLILLCTGAIIFLMITLFTSQVLAGLLFAYPFWLCTLVCLAFKRSAWLWCCWVIFLLGDLYIRYATGLNWKAINMTLYFEPWMNPARLAIAWVMLALTVLMIILTVRELRKRKLPELFQNKIFLTGMWIVIVLSFLPSALFPERIFALYFVAVDWVQIAVLIAAILSTIKILRKEKESTTENL